MRISQALLTNFVQQRTENASRSYVEASAKLAATSGVERPSADPVKASRLNQLARFRSEMTIFDTNRSAVETDLTNMETVLGDMHDILVRAKDVALAMRNDTNTADDRENGSQEVQRLLDQFMGLANRRHTGGKYMFAGLQEDTPPLDGNGNFVGDNFVRRVEIGPGVTVEATMGGQRAFGPNNEVIDVLQNLTNVLDANDGPGIGDTLDLLDEARQILSLARTDVGARLATIHDVSNLSGDINTRLDLEKADLISIDVARYAPQLNAAQTALQAVVDVSRGMIEQVGSAWLR